MFVTFIEVIVLALLLFFRNNDLPDGFNVEDVIIVKYTKS